MIGKVMKGRGFAGLARYLETGRTGNTTDRVEWIEARNLPTNDPQTASLLMRATAAQSDRVQKPVYHIALSFDPDDAVDHATMVRVADRLLADLGLNDHQALIVAHGDTRHPHLHIMVNRVHPETHRAWDPKNDYADIERSLREQERELAFRAVPGHHHRLDGHEQPDRSQSLTTGQLRRWERTGDVPFDELVRHAVRRDVQEAGSWLDLDARLRKQGLWIEARGRGLVVTDGNESIKASSIAPGISRNNLEARFGMYGDQQRYEQLERAEGSPRTVEANERDGGNVARNSRDAVESTQQVERNGRDNLDRAGADGRPDRAHASRNGSGGDAAERNTSNRSNSPAESAPPSSERHRTESGVHRREAAPAGRTSRVDADERDRAGADRRDVGRPGRGALDPRLDGLRRSIGDLERRLELETARDRAGEELQRARMRAAPFQAQRAEARELSQRFRAALAEVYRNPVAARHEFHRRAQRDGVAVAAPEISRQPERFGELRGVQVGPIRSEGRRQAAEAAAKLEHLGGEHVVRIREAWASRGEHREVNSKAAELEHRVRALDAQLARGAGSAQLQHRIARELRALHPVQRQTFQRSLPMPHQRMLTAAMAVGHAFAREQGHER